MESLQKMATIYYIYLPAKNPGEKVPLPKIDKEYIDACEHKFICYAWPVEQGGRTFAMDQTGGMVLTNLQQPTIYLGANKPSASERKCQTRKTETKQKEPKAASDSINRSKVLTNEI